MDNLHGIFFTAIMVSFTNLYTTSEIVHIPAQNLENEVRTILIAAVLLFVT